MCRSRGRSPFLLSCLLLVLTRSSSSQDFCLRNGLHCSGKIVSFDGKTKQFRVEYDDGRQEDEQIAAKTFFPDPQESQRRLAHPIAPPELGVCLRHLSCHCSDAGANVG